MKQRSKKPFRGYSVVTAEFALKSLRNHATVMPGRRIAGQARSSGLFLGGGSEQSRGLQQVVLSQRAVGEERPIALDDAGPVRLVRNRV